MILKFPKQKRRKTLKPVRGATARVHAFPAARHCKMAQIVAKEMRAAARRASGDPIDAAEAELIEYLEIDWSRLQEIGVTEPEREQEVRSFAVAAWAAFGRQDDRSGAA